VHVSNSGTLLNIETSEFSENRFINSRLYVIPDYYKFSGKDPAIFETRLNSDTSDFFLEKTTILKKIIEFEMTFKNLFLTIGAIKKLPKLLIFYKEKIIWKPSYCFL
jgi:hypothetical protein